MYLNTATDDLYLKPVKWSFFFLSCVVLDQNLDTDTCMMLMKCSGYKLVREPEYSPLLS